MAKHRGIAAGIANESERSGADAVLDQLHVGLRDALETVGDQGSVSADCRTESWRPARSAMSVMMAALLRSRGVTAAHVFADTVIATDDRFGSARPNRERTRAQAESVVLPLARRGQDRDHDRIYRRRPRRPDHDARAAADPITAPPFSERRSTPTRSRSGPMCPACSAPIRARYRKHGSCPRSVTRRRRNWPILAPKCSIRARSGPPWPAISRSAFSRHLRPSNRERSSRRASDQRIKAVTTDEGSDDALGRCAGTRGSVGRGGNGVPATARWSGRGRACRPGFLAGAE